ncbi:MAG: CocE/NonD family hydrolase [Alphaproteobacteria bacterium]
MLYRQPEDLPHGVREIMTEWITLKDGTRLAARLWLPEEASAAAPVPAVLEYLPYRRRDGTTGRDSVTYPWLAGHGIAGVRVDVRGTGDSEGVILDEYDRPELQDAVEVIAWIAAQPWCTGNVGMWGISWGGFNSLQVAALRPPALKAIITIASTDDRYHGDCHFMGGCWIDGNMGWGNQFFSNTTRPPDPTVVGERWRAMWLDRLEKMTLPMEIWLHHQRRDDYWRHGSVCEDYSDITCAVYAVGGWADGYTNSVFSMIENLSCPKKALVGPWAHAFPHMARPGPAIGFLQEAKRWWDHLLKGEDTGVMDEPMLRLWMQDHVPPRRSYGEWPGRWVAETAWPPPGLTPATLYLGADGLSDGETAESVHSATTPQELGLKAADWCPYGRGPDMSDDQRSEDGLSLSFDSPPLAERMEILGAPVVTLDLSVDRRQAFVAVRLNDVAPDGSSLRVSYGLLNLSHRDGSEFPQATEPGKRYRVQVKLCHIAHAFPVGHRVRIAVSTTYWPIAWPSPEPVALTLYGGKSEVRLPVRPADPALDDSLEPFAQPEAVAQNAHVALRTPEPFHRTEFNSVTGETRYIRRRDRGRTRHLDVDLEEDVGGYLTHSIFEGDAQSASSEAEQTHRFLRGEWDVRTSIRSHLTATSEDFLLRASVDAYEGETRVFSRTWNVRVPRDHQ